MFLPRVHCILVLWFSYLGLKTHTKRHKSLEDLRCPETGCDIKFHSKTHWSNHIRLHSRSHEDISKIGACSNDSREFEDSNSNSIASANSLTLGCPETGCQMTFSTMSGLSNHYIQMHRSNDDLSFKKEFTGKDDEMVPRSSSFDSNIDMLVSALKAQDSNNTGQKVLDGPNSSFGLDRNSWWTSRNRSNTMPLESSQDANMDSSVSDNHFFENAYFDPTLTDGYFLCSRENTITTDEGTVTTVNSSESVATQNPSDILSLLDQSYFTIDDSEAALRLLSFLATRGNLHILNESGETGEEFGPTSSNTSPQGYNLNNSSNLSAFNVAPNNTPQPFGNAMVNPSISPAGSNPFPSFNPTISPHSNTNFTVPHYFPMDINFPVFGNLKVDTNQTFGNSTLPWQNQNSLLFNLNNGNMAKKNNERSPQQNQLSCRPPLSLSQNIPPLQPEELKIEPGLAQDNVFPLQQGMGFEVNMNMQQYPTADVSTNAFQFHPSLLVPPKSQSQFDLPSFSEWQEMQSRPASSTQTTTCHVNSAHPTTKHLSTSGGSHTL